MERVTEVMVDPTVLKEHMITMLMQKEVETGAKMEENLAAGN